MTKTKQKKPKGSDKLTEAHYKNVFGLKVLEVARAVSENDLYKLLTPDILNDIFFYRTRAMKVIADESLHLRPSELNNIRDHIISQLKESVIRINSKLCNNITLYDLSGPGLSLFTYLHRMKDKKQVKYLKLFEAFRDFMDSDDLEIELEKTIYKVTNFIDWDFTWPDKRIISSKISFKITTDTDPQYLYIEVSFNVFQPESIRLDFKGKSLIAYKLVLPVNGRELKIIKIQPDKLHLNTEQQNDELPVYIQSQALYRLRERINCNQTRVLYLSLISSFDKPKCLFYHENLLMEFYFVFVKVGYLIIDIIDDKAVIRDFWLLTHVDTPERDDLQRNAIEAKADISCLEIDNINTFLYSFIDKNSLLYHLLDESGCSSLFNISRKYFEKGIDIKMEAIDEYLLQHKDHREQMSFKDLLT